ncbi:MAG: VanZ family protein [Chloroflexi bacterium]|nr:VanZ family protein [Chloroflexota bacterium]
MLYFATSDDERGASLTLARFFRWLPPAAIMLVIYVLSDQSALAGTGEPAISRKLVHAAEYAALAFTLGRATVAELTMRAPAPPYSTTFGAAWFFAVLYAASDEVHQSFVPGRSGRIEDFLVDAIGAAMGAGLLILARWYVRRRAARMTPTHRSSA